MNKEGLFYYLNIAYELGRWAFALVIVGTFIHYFIATIFIISGPSMESSFHSGEVVLVSRIGLFTGKYSRGDPMVIKFPGDPEKKKYIKRLIGLPKEKLEIKDNKVYINNKELVETYVSAVAMEYLPVFDYEQEEWNQEAAVLHSQGKALIKPDMVSVLGQNDYFLMGDNRENSNDSRKWYPAPKSDLIGPVRFILWPLKDWGPVVNPYYGS
jgi:signal peptidase I